MVKFKDVFPEDWMGDLPFIMGIALWDVPSILYRQTNNLVEEIRRKTIIEVRARDKGDIKKILPAHMHKKVDVIYAKHALEYLESCMASTAGTLWEGEAVISSNNYRKFPDGSVEGFDDTIMAFLNLVRNNREFDTGDIFDNRNLHNFETLYRLWFGKKSIYCRDLSFEQASVYLKQGYGIHMIFKNPGHAFPAIAYNQKRHEIIRHDVWRKNPLNKRDGYYEALTKHDYETNVKNRALVYVP
jgi:hypothetical protein